MENTNEDGQFIEALLQNLKDDNVQQARLALFSTNQRVDDVTMQARVTFVSEVIEALEETSVRADISRQIEDTSVLNSRVKDIGSGLAAGMKVSTKDHLKQPNDRNRVKNYMSSVGITAEKASGNTPLAGRQYGAFLSGVILRYAIERQNSTGDKDFYENIKVIKNIANELTKNQVFHGQIMPHLKIVLEKFKNKGVMGTNLTILLANID